MKRKMIEYLIKNTKYFIKKLQGFEYYLKDKIRVKINNTDLDDAVSFITKNPNQIKTEEIAHTQTISISNCTLSELEQEAIIGLFDRGETD